MLDSPHPHGTQRLPHDAWRTSGECTVSLSSTRRTSQSLTKYNDRCYQASQICLSHQRSRGWIQLLLLTATCDALGHLKLLYNGVRCGIGTAEDQGGGYRASRTLPGIRNGARCRCVGNWIKFQVAMRLILTNDGRCQMCQKHCSEQPGGHRMTQPWTIITQYSLSSSSCCVLTPWQPPLHPDLCQR